MRNRFWRGEFDCQKEIKVPTLVDGTEKRGELTILKYEIDFGTGNLIVRMKLRSQRWCLDPKTLLWQVPPPTLLWQADHGVGASRAAQFTA